jgi:pyruvate/2-oxoglutarate dehydrogenase complex dihydrolipoamide acyltransferase (E2) component
MLDVTLPQLGESITEGTVTRLLKKVGDTVQIDEPLFEVSTDKVDTEVPSPVAGVVTEILVAEGDTVLVGTIVYRLSDGAAPFTTPAPVAQPAPAPATTPAPAVASPTLASDVVNVELPQLGESITEGTVTRLLKKVGDTVQIDEPLFEVSTDKVDTEVPSPVAGVVTEILVAEGDTVSAGAVVLRVAVNASLASAPAPAPVPAVQVIPSSPPPAPASAPVVQPPLSSPPPVPVAQPAPAPKAPAVASTEKTSAPVLRDGRSRTIPVGPGFQPVPPATANGLGYAVCAQDVSSLALSQNHTETLSRAAFALARALEKMHFSADSFSFEIPVPPQHTLHVQLPRVTDLRLGALTTAVAALKERVENKAVAPNELAPSSVLIRFDDTADHSSLSSESMVLTLCAPREEVLSINGSFAIRTVCELTLTAPSDHALSGVASKLLRTVALELENRAWDKEG